MLPWRWYNHDIKHHDKFDHRAHNDDLHRAAYKHVYDDDFHPIFYDDDFLDHYFPPCDDDEHFKHVDNASDRRPVRHRSRPAVPGRDDTRDRDHVREPP